MFLVSFLFAGIAHADTGLLSVDIVVTNSHGGNLTQNDFPYDINYDGSTQTMFAPISSSTPFNFMYHKNMNLPLQYSVVPHTVSGYTMATSSDCAGEGETDSPHLEVIKTLNCTIYAVDDGYPLPTPVFYPLPVVESTPIIQPTPIIENPSGSIPVQSIVSPAEDPQVQALRAQLVSLMQELISLLNQLIALKK